MPFIAPAPGCRNCGTLERPIKQLGLCWLCYGLPAVRSQFQAKTKPPPDEDFEGDAPLPTTSTQATPGSVDKVRVLVERAARREQLFHPLDVRLSENVGLEFLVAERLRTREATEEARRNPKPSNKPKKKKPKRREILWRRWPCCLFGAITRGRCECSVVRGKRTRMGRARAPSVHVVRSVQLSLYDSHQWRPPLAAE